MSFTAERAAAEQGGTVTSLYDHAEFEPAQLAVQLSDSQKNFLFKLMERHVLEPLYGIDTRSTPAHVIMRKAEPVQEDFYEFAGGLLRQVGAENEDQYYSRLEALVGEYVKAIDRNTKLTEKVDEDRFQRMLAICEEISPGFIKDYEDFPLRERLNSLETSYNYVEGESARKERDKDSQRAHEIGLQAEREALAKLKAQRQARIKQLGYPETDLDAHLLTEAGQALVHAATNEGTEKIDPVYLKYAAANVLRTYSDDATDSNIASQMDSVSAGVEAEPEIPQPPVDAAEPEPVTPKPVGVPAAQEAEAEPEESFDEAEGPDEEDFSTGEFEQVEDDSPEFKRLMDGLYKFDHETVERDGELYKLVPDAPTLYKYLKNLEASGQKELFLNIQKRALDYTKIRLLKEVTTRYAHLETYEDICQAIATDPDYAGLLADNPSREADHFTGSLPTFVELLSDYMKVEFKRRRYNSHFTRFHSEAADKNETQRFYVTSPARVNYLRRFNVYAAKPGNEE